MTTTVTEELDLTVEAALNQRRLDIDETDLPDAESRKRAKVATKARTEANAALTAYHRAFDPEAETAARAADEAARRDAFAVGKAFVDPGTPNLDQLHADRRSAAHELPGRIDLANDAAAALLDAVGDWLAANPDPPTAASSAFADALAQLLPLAAAADLENARAEWLRTLGRRRAWDSADVRRPGPLAQAIASLAAGATTAGTNLPPV